LPTDGVEAVIHLAAMQPANVSGKTYDPSKYIEVNVIGTINILEYCRKAKINKIIYVSSHRNTQGLWKYGKPVREEDGRSIKYDGQYAMFSISESAAQDCVEHYRIKYGMKGLIFRLPPVYGYGPHTEIFWHGKPIKTGFQIFVENAMAGKPIEIWGDSNIGRDIIYIKDVTEAFLHALKSNDAEGLYNITSGRAITLKEEVETIVKVFCQTNGKSVITYKPEQPNSIEPFFYDNSKAKKDLGWAPRYSLEDMLNDYKKEMESGKFSFLVEKRRRLLEQQ
jgi:UDP-glucose 4-epimerase